MNIGLASMHIVDIPSLMQLKDAEGWNQTAEDWEFLITQNPDYCLVAKIQDKVIGSVTAMCYSDDLAWIGMMLVDHAHRGTGIGKLLLQEIIDRLGAIKSIGLDATPAGKPLYAKLGFIPELEICRMTIPPTRESRLDAPGYKNIQAITEANLPAVIASDQKIIGTNRGPLLEYLFDANKTDPYFQEKQDGTSSYLLGRAGTRYTQLGPLSAHSSAQAIALLTEALTGLKGKPVVVDVLADKIGLVSWLKSIGFIEQRRLVRMYLRENRLAGQVEKQYLIAGPELG